MPAHEPDAATRLLRSRGHDAQKARVRKTFLTLDVERKRKGLLQKRHAFCDAFGGRQPAPNRCAFGFNHVRKYIYSVAKSGALLEFILPDALHNAPPRSKASGRIQLKETRRFPRKPPDQSIFHSWQEFKDARPITFAIDGFLQNDAATLIGGLSEHGKTLILLSLVKALFSKPGTKLWGHFEVREQASRVIYLIPESGLTPFKHRIQRFGLSGYVKDGQLLVHTLSKGVAPSLDDPRLLKEVRGGHVFLDTAIRFGEGEENQASDNQQGLATKIFGLLNAGASSVVGCHHAPKLFAKQYVMTLENILRGSGDIGAMVATAWGVRQLDREYTLLHIENIKARDFQPCGPFQIIGRPYIDKEGDFRMHKKPGECGSLTQAMGANSNKGGAEKSPKRAKKLKLLAEWLLEKPNMTSAQASKRFKKHGYTVAPSTARTYLAEVRKKTKGF
jgi:hypothetical protein